MRRERTQLGSLNIVGPVLATVPVKMELNQQQSVEDFLHDV